MNNVKKVRFAEPITSSSKTQQVESSKTSDSNTPVLSSTGVKCSTSNCESKPPGNKNNDRISQTPSRNKKNKVVQIVLWYLDSECSKYITGNRSQLMNFVSKFMGIVRFENNQIARIMGYGDYQLGNVVISRNGVVKRRNQTLVEASRTMLIFSRAPLFLWDEAINTACYTQNHSLIRLRYNKTLYELMQDKKPDLSFFHVFGSLCYPTNDHDDLGKFDAKADIGIFVGYAPAKKAFRIYNRRTWIITETIHVTFDELTAMASEQFSSGPGLHYMTPATPSTGLVSNPVSQQPCILPIRDDWHRLFQPMFDEYFNPPTIVVSSVQEVAAPRAEVLADSLVSTSIDLNAPSTSIPTLQEQEHSPIISQGFEESPKTPKFHNDPLNESPNEDSTSHGSSSNVRQLYTLLEHIGR
ncbi:retrovirus-related pol polyprotein from transposon TNT 1-94 [Tanacetum coccineum]